MPGRFLQVPGGVVSYEAYYQGTLAPNQKEQSTHWSNRWAYEDRSQKLNAVFGYGWEEPTDAWWPATPGALNDPAAPTYLIDGNSGQNTFSPGPFEPWNYGAGGSRSSKYIMGQCKDSLGNALGGCVVKCFRTSDDVEVGIEAQTDDKGFFEIMCPNSPADQHYLVAYYQSGLLAGATINTIVPKWRDGT